MIDLTDSHYKILTDIRDRERDGVKRMLTFPSVSLYELEEFGLVEIVTGKWKLYIPTFLGHVVLAAWEARACQTSI